MTKKDAAAFEALRKELRIARAMRFTDPVWPDVPPPNGVSGSTHGWTYSAYQRVVVEKAWSESSSHGKGWPNATIRFGGSQNSIWLYSSRLLALRAGRHDLEMQFARTLAEVDAEIEREIEHPEAAQ